MGAGLKVERMTLWTAGLGKAARGTPVPGLAWTLALVLGAEAPAAAQVNTRSNSPIDITADQAEVINAKCVAIWRGSAEAIQDKSRLRADTLTVYSRVKGGGSNGQPACGGVERIVADGHVYYVTPDQNARGDHATYVQDRNEIVITGDVIVVHGQDVARGDKLTINVSTHEAQMQSSVTGAGRPGRVRAVVYPDKTSGGAGAAKP
ncbi:MAG: OstA family protein [Caulobacteraceae bacterium]|nr:OstA family protein [Caulobacteraceae bacterium]